MYVILYIRHLEYLTSELGATRMFVFSNNDNLIIINAYSYV